MISREQIQKELDKALQQRGVGSLEGQQMVAAITLQVLLDIRDLLSSIDSTGFDIDYRQRDSLK